MGKLFKLAVVLVLCFFAARLYAQIAIAKNLFACSIEENPLGAYASDAAVEQLRSRLATCADKNSNLVVRSFYSKDYVAASIRFQRSSSGISWTALE